jgi:hypothetical protein
MSKPKRPPTTATVPLWHSLARAVVGRLGWLIGAPILVFGCGFLLLWWNLFQQRNQIATLQDRASVPVEARLVDRYYRILPTDLQARPGYSVCTDACTIALNTVAVFEFARPDGPAQRVQFESWAHDWQHNTEFELGLPLLHAEFRAPPDFLAHLRAERASYDASKTLWDLFWGPADDAGHWLLRLREPRPDFRAALRYDPDDPATAILDLPRFAPAQARDRDGMGVLVTAMLAFVGVIALMVIFPAVQLMLHGAPRKLTAIVTAAICAGLPLWAPHAERIAPWLSDHAGALALELKREFGGSTGLPAYVSRPVEDTRALAVLRWELASSPQAAFLAGLDTTLPAGVDPLDHAGAYDALQASFDRQLRAMPTQAAGAVLKQLRHHQADTVWELFVPALLRIVRDESAPAEQREDAGDLLGFFASDWALPDVDVFLYRHRLDNYARLREAPDPALRALAARRLGEAEARLARQLATP